MSACGNIGPLLDGYFDGELDPSERTRVERHLATCAVCRRDLASLGAVGNAVRATVAGTHSPDLWRGIEAHLRPPRATRTPRRARAPQRGHRWLPGAATAAAVASVFLATFQLAQPLPPVADAGPTGVVRSIYAPERPVMVMEAEKSDDPTIIWLMDDPPPEAEAHVRI